MTIRSIKWAAGVSLFAAVLAVGTIAARAQASAQVQAVPREGVAFNDTVTQRVKIETVDPEDRTVAFTLPDGQVLVLPVAAVPATSPPSRRLDGQRHLHPDRDHAEPAPEGPGLQGSAPRAR